MNSLGNGLLLDTTSNALKIGISRGPELAYTYNQHAESHRYHSAVLIPLIQEGLREAGMAVKDLSFLAVNIGPGSFTGIRTGITTIRTMAQFLHLPVYVFNTFELLAAGQAPDAPAVDVYLDALRGRAYYAGLHSQQGRPVLSTEPALVTLSETDIEPGTLILADKSLTSFLGGVPTQAVDENLLTPAVMLNLIQGAAEHYLRPWPEISPLYIQTPNITQRKAKPGSFK